MADTSLEELLALLGKFEEIELENIKLEAEELILSLATRMLLPSAAQSPA
jgi:CO dehydrogenase/acetyl-CoA synthase delta subunit